MGKKILVWFRNDLRLHDNEMLVEAISKADEILPVYIFDPRHFQKTAYHTYKTGATRAKFLLQSVASLQQSLQGLGGNLLVLSGYPEELLPELVAKYELSEVYHHREVAGEETAVSVSVEDALWKLKVNLKHFIGHTLYNKEDLPFPIKDIPDVFTQFKKKTERDAIVKPCFATPTTISFVSADDWGAIPEINALLQDSEANALTLNSEFVGGEKEALSHLHDYLHAGEGMILANASLKKHEIVSKLSAWLALGCLSPREVYWKMQDAEAIYGVKPYFHQIILGLLWRDYFRFMFKKYGGTFFTPQGFKKDALDLPLNYSQQLQGWKLGQTGQPLVDAFMEELNTKGYINQVARQLVATYLVKVLGINWVLGAAYFEEKLIDYCPASNWGNWATVAGVGNDQKLSSSFDFEKLLKFLDPKGAFAQVVQA
ncbi:DASH family cryptochrome [Nubsella zeaxanthinifaciens]|uniref:DASH family cryptochrome n=1 Tax=Nubsella zeaxanthinifaciens TaxID=392412 RepID=UPI000DE26641|nr:DASH family cryptochrome [Nubsella zeaxanthinifaciens]